MNYFPWLAGGAAAAYALGRTAGRRGVIEPPRKFIQTVTDWYMRDPATQRRQLFTISLRDTPYAPLLPKVKAKWKRQADRLEKRLKEADAWDSTMERVVASHRRSATGEFDLWVATTDNLPPGVGGSYNMIQGILLPTNASRRKITGVLEHEAIHALQDVLFQSTFSRKGGGMPPSAIRGFDPLKSGSLKSGFEHMASDVEFYTRLYDTRREAEAFVGGIWGDRVPTSRLTRLHTFLRNDDWLCYLRRYSPGKYRRAVSEITAHIMSTPDPEHKPRLPHWEKKEVQWYTIRQGVGGEPFFAVALKDKPYTQAGAVFERPSKKWGIWLPKTKGYITRMEKVPRKSWATKEEAVARVLEGQEGIYVGDFRR